MIISNETKEELLTVQRNAFYWNVAAWLSIYSVFILINLMPKAGIIINTFIVIQLAIFNLFWARYQKYLGDLLFLKWQKIIIKPLAFVFPFFINIFDISTFYLCIFVFLLFSTCYGISWYFYIKEILSIENFNISKWLHTQGLVLEEQKNVERFYDDWLFSNLTPMEVPLEIIKKWSAHIENVELPKYFNGDNSNIEKLQNSILEKFLQISPNIKNSKEWETASLIGKDLIDTFEIYIKSKNPNTLEDLEFNSF